MNTDRINKDDIQEDIKKAIENNHGPTFARFALAALGSVPLAGGAIAGVGGAWSEKEQSKVNGLFHAWMKLQEEDLENIGKTLVKLYMK